MKNAAFAQKDEATGLGMPAGDPTDYGTVLITFQSGFIITFANPQ